MLNGGCCTVAIRLYACRLHTPDFLLTQKKVSQGYCHLVQKAYKILLTAKHIEEHATRRISGEIGEEE